VYVIVWYVSGFDDAAGQLLKTLSPASPENSHDADAAFNKKVAEVKSLQEVEKDEKAWKVRLYDPEGKILKSESPSPNSEPFAPISDVLDSDWVHATFICEGPSSCGFVDDSAKFNSDSVQDRTMGIVKCQKCNREQTLSVADFKMNAWRLANIPPATSYKTLNSGPCEKHIKAGTACSGWNFEEVFCNKHRSTLMEIKTV
jgi:hypothetical protein